MSAAAARDRPPAAATALSAIFKPGRCVLWGPGGAPGNWVEERGGSTSGGFCKAGWSPTAGGWRLETHRERRHGRSKADRWRQEDVGRVGHG